MRTLFVVSANLPNGPIHDPAGPLKDYVAITLRLGADVLDQSRMRRVPAARRIEQALGPAAAQAWAAAEQHERYDAVLTDGEQIGLPLALLLKRAQARVPLVTIGHRLSTRKKLPFFRVLKVQTHVSRVILHSRCQYGFATEQLGFRPDQISLVPYQVDTNFWSRPAPLQTREERLVVSAGLEHRDYPTLFKAVAGVDARVVIGAASHWSKCRSNARSAPRPPNVEIDSFDYRALRELYARAAIVVVPLEDVDFQAGVTTILEAMAMGKAVITTHAVGQTDVVEDPRAMTRGAPSGPRPISLLRELAEQAGIQVEPTGLYVPPTDPEALRRAIVYLLDHPDVRARMGASGQRMVRHLTTVEQYAERIAQIVEQTTGEGRLHRRQLRASASMMR
jgi:glycosyltransferase involved in cell wall biosynthesis